MDRQIRRLLIIMMVALITMAGFTFAVDCSDLTPATWFGEDLDFNVGKACSGSEDPESLSICSSDWGMQGPVVIVCDCGSIIPALVSLTVESPDAVVDCIKSGTISVCGDTAGATQIGGGHLFAVSGDKDIFTASYSEKDNPSNRGYNDWDYLFGLACSEGSIGIGLKQFDCDSLASAGAANVFARGQSVYYSFDDCSEFCTGCDDDTIFARKLFEPEHLGSVSVSFKGQSPCPDPRDSGDDGGGGDDSDGNDSGKCSSGSCGSSPQKTNGNDYPKLSAGNAQASTDGNYSQTSYGSLTCGNEAEVNIGGFWHRTGYRRGWDYSECGSPLKGSSGAYTKIEFTVEDPQGHEYAYEISGSWTSVQQASLETRGRIPMKNISRGGAGICDFHYHSTSNNVLTQASSGNDFIVYSYGNGNTKASVAGEKPSRLWAGNNTQTSGHAHTGTEPTDGRWVDMWYDDNGMMTRVKKGGCSSCGASDSFYHYTESNLREDDYLTTEYGKVLNDTSEVTINSYRYDSIDRVTSHYLGAHGSGLKVSAWEYDVEDIYTQVDTTMVRRDYVDNSQSRVGVYYMNDAGTITREVYYHDLQSDGTELSGGYSAVDYVMEERYFRRSN